MVLSDELYFEITVEGTKRDVKRFAAFLTSGDLDDFFAVSEDYISYEDDFASMSDADLTSLVFSNDDLGIEIDEFDPEEYLDAFCRMGADVDIHGHLYDLNDEEFRFVSPKGDCGYTDASRIARFNDELDEQAYEEENGETGY